MTTRAYCVKQIAQANDTRVPPADSPITLGTADEAEDPNAIWLVAAEEISEEDRVGADGGTAVLAVEIATLWLSESDAWLTHAFTDGDIRQHERQIFAGDEQPAITDTTSSLRLGPTIRRVYATLHSISRHVSVLSR